MSSITSADETTHLSTPTRKIPIIVVPGIMGTRLCEPRGHDLVWNPTGDLAGRCPGDGALDAARLANVAAPLVPDEWNLNGYAPDRADRAQGITNFYHLVTDFYDDLCFALNEDKGGLLKPMSCEPRVYACGYDWRLDNRIAAERLKRVVDVAVEECGERALLVAHSQGGLVCRYYCHQLGGQSAVRALFLIGSPTLGAVQVYARLKRGITFWDDDWVTWFLGKAMGLSPTESRELLRAFPSMYQLLPNEIFTRHRPSDERSRLWLEFNRALSGYPYEMGDHLPSPLADAASSFPRVYEDVYTGFGEQTAARMTYFGHVQEATLFHEELTVPAAPNGPARAYMHPNTYCIACLNLSTPVLADLDEGGTLYPEGTAWTYLPKGSAPTDPGEMTVTLTYEEAGDGQVPALSCSPEADLLSNPFKPFGDSLRPDGRVDDVEHGSLPNDEEVIRLIVEEIPRILAAEDLSECEDEVEPPEPSGCPRCAADITGEQLRALFPTGADARIEEMRTVFNEAFEKFDMNTCLRRAHFFAQVRTEVGASIDTVLENLNYSEARLVEVFSYFKRHPDQAALYGRTADHPAYPEEIANRAYADRNGNHDIASGDGWRYRGKGYLQLTGRAIYQGAQDAIDDRYPRCGIDIIHDDSDILTVKGGLISALGYWTWQGLNAKADEGDTGADVDAITAVVNLHTDSYGERRTNFETTKVVFRVEECICE